jgi:hypothetical protein
MNLDSSFVLPVRRDVSTRLVQMNVLIDMIDPRDRDEVVMFAVGGLCLVSLILSGPSRWSTFPTVFRSEEMTSMCSRTCDASDI